MSSPSPSHRRIPRLVAIGAGLALVGGGALSQFGADADPVSSDVPATCSILGSSLDVTIPVVVDDTFDPVVEGTQQIVVLETGMSQLEVEVTMERLIVTLPIPGEIASVDEVTFSGGNMTGSWVMSGADLVLTFTGPQPSSAMDLPTVTIDQTVATGIAPGTITWTTFSKIDAETNYGTASCTPNDPNQVMNTTQVEAADVEPPPVEEPSEPTDPTDPTVPVPDGPDGPDGPDPAEPPAEGEPGVSVEVEAEVDAPAVPALPGVPAVPGVPTPGPGDPGLPAAPGLPPLPSSPPSVPLPGFPGLPEGPAPTLPPTPALPTLPGIELDVEVTLEVGVGA